MRGSAEPLHTDPLHPFHTAQSEAENNIHRAVEWSISKAYDELYALGKGEFDRIEVDIPRDPNWLAQLVCQGAEMANGYYEKLIAHYDIQRGISDPPAGLDQVAKRIVSRLIWYANISFAAVLDRAIDDSNMHPPETRCCPPPCWPRCRCRSRCWPSASPTPRSAGRSSACTTS